MTYHTGELAVQAKAGVELKAQRIGKGIHMTMPYIAQQFLENQVLAMVGSVDVAGQVWASLLIGEPGFLVALDDQTIQLNLSPSVHDSLLNNLAENPQIGLLLIDLATRQRMRVNGTVVSTPDALMLITEQVYSNCQKYIQKRTITPIEHGEISSSQMIALTDTQQYWLTQADTFFIASYHPAGGADISHRGGNPGFVRVVTSQKIEFPDYAGNMMFNTLGNIAENPQIGLLFIDFEQGNILQLTGVATIVWDAARIASFPQAERIVEFEIKQIIETKHVIPFKFDLEHRSPHNPII